MTTNKTNKTKLSQLQHGDVFSLTNRKNAVVYILVESPFDHFDYTEFGLKSYFKSRVVLDRSVIYKGDIVDYVL